jgi:hypothetical protein
MCRGGKLTAAATGTYGSVKANSKNENPERKKS